MRKLIAFVVLITMITMIVGCGVEGYSDGDRYGIVNKFSHKGKICKSWEGELNLGGLTNASGTLTPNISQFSVRDQDAATVVLQLQKAAESGKRVKVHYAQAYLSPVCETDTDYFVKSVEILPQ